MARSHGRPPSRTSSQVRILLTRPCASTRSAKIAGRLHLTVPAVHPSEASKGVLQLTPCALPASAGPICCLRQTPAWHMDRNSLGEAEGLRKALQAQGGCISCPGTNLCRGSGRTPLSLPFSCPGTTPSVEAPGATVRPGVRLGKWHRTLMFGKMQTPEKQCATRPLATGLPFPSNVGDPAKSWGARGWAHGWDHG